MKQEDDIQVETFMLLFNKYLLITTMGKTQFRYLRFSNKQNVNIPSYSCSFNKGKRENTNMYIINIISVVNAMKKIWNSINLIKRFLKLQS